VRTSSSDGEPHSAQQRTGHARAALHARQTLEPFPPRFRERKLRQKKMNLPLPCRKSRLCSSCCPCEQPGSTWRSTLSEVFALPCEAIPPGTVLSSPTKPRRIRHAGYVWAARGTTQVASRGSRSTYSGSRNRGRATKRRRPRPSERRSKT